MNEQLAIVDTITKIFNGSDRHDWDLVRECFQFEVYLDYFSLSKIPGAKIKASEIIERWSNFLPSFAFTHHVLSNFEVSFTSELASAFCKGSALHYLPDSEGGDTWTTIGSYDIRLTKVANNWKVVSMTFHLIYEEGNKNLAAIAMNKK